MSLYFYLFFCTYLFYNPLYLCAYLISQRLRPSVVLLQLLSSSFHSKLLLLPIFTVNSPPSTSIFFFLFLSWSNNLSTTSTNLHHKNKNPPAPQESKPTSTDSIDPQEPISAASTDLSLCWFVYVGVFVYLCVDLSVCLCLWLCVGVFVFMYLRKKTTRREVSLFCSKKGGKKKRRKT